jgi:hypothetical protein
VANDKTRQAFGKDEAKESRARTEAFPRRISVGCE